MNIIYAVPWIEVEYGWGDRPEGYKVFNTLEECITSTKESSNKGNYNGGYFGPARPLGYYEVPIHLVQKDKIFINNLPDIKSSFKPIN
jgi:hypothetical protein